MKKHLHPNKNSGFTLIELLIVIAIIGILAAVLISVINPAKQKAKAQDAGTISTMNKMILATQSYYSAYNTYPTCAVFIAELLNATGDSACTTAGSYKGTITITASPQAIYYNGGTGTTACFRAASLGNTAQGFVWNNTINQMLTLPSAAVTGGTNDIIDYCAA